MQKSFFLCTAVVLFIFSIFGFEAQGQEDRGEAFKKLHNPGKLYPGVAQNINETENPNAQKTKELTVGTENKTVDEKITILKKEMSEWGKNNKDMKELEPFRDIPLRK